jgi:GTP-binding protein EngB required for normal cell division
MESLLNEAQQRRILANAQYADKLLSDIEAILTASESKALFPKYTADLTPPQIKLVRDSAGRFRDQLARALEGLAIKPPGAKFGANHSIRVTLTFVRIAVQEMAPPFLRGYGEVRAEVAPQLQGVCSELEGLIERLNSALAQNPAADLRQRLARLQQEGSGVDALQILEQVITDRGLVELRARLAMILERLESRQFEIAVFGRVSSGKSSLLNSVLGTHVLPVGVNPITAVPTRLVFGPEALLTVSFADRRVERLPLDRLSEFVSEAHNPGNAKAVVRLAVQLPAERLKEGLGFVDTPGLGSLATAGAAETRAYLPQCDLGVVLISAGSPVNEEDISTVQLLLESGIPVHVLLSKADLLGPADLESALAYTSNQFQRQLGATIDIHPVSTAASHASLLNQWFQNEIAPLYEKHQQLAQASIERKTGALREAAEAILDARLHRGAPVRLISRDESLAAEKDLRLASAELEQAREYCLRAADEVRGLASFAIDKAVAAVLASCAGDHHCADDVGAIALDSIRRAVVPESEIHARLVTLADRLRGALERTGRAIGGRDVPERAEFLSAIPEVPRLDLPPTTISLPSPWSWRTLSLARMRLRRKFEQTLEEPLNHTLAIHARMVESWARRALSALQAVFDSTADAYRSELAASAARQDLPEDEREAMAGDLERLRSLAGRASTTENRDGVAHGPRA